MRDLSQLTLDDFTAQAGTTFTLHYGADARLDVVLTEVSARGVYPPNRRQGFALTLQSTITAYLPQETYLVTHPVMGEMALFIVPIGPNAVGMRYEINFN